VNPAPTRSIAIIGAGITGLTAAWHLMRQGIPVTIYEASDRTGGVIRSRRDGPWLAEGGPNTLLETSPVIRDFVDALGLASRRHYSHPDAGARFVVRDARPVELPGSALGFFRCRLFSTAAKLRLFREPFVSRGEGEESVAAFVKRRLGQEFLDYAIDPLVTGIYAGDPATLSVQHAFPRVYALEAQYGSLIRGQFLGARARKRRGDVSKATARKLSFDDGLQVLPDTLHTALREHVRLGTEVLALEPAPRGWRVEVRGPDGPRQDEHRVMLVTGTAPAVARLPIRSQAVPSLAGLAEVRYPPVTSVVLGFRRADVTHPCCGFGMLIPHREGFRILGTIFSSALFPWRAPEDHVTLTVYVGGARRPEVASLDDGPLVDLVVEDLRRLLGVNGRPVFAHLQRWPKAIPQYEVGYARYKELLDRVEALAPGLFFAGNYRDGVALSDSILTGARVAGRIQEHLSAAAGSSQVTAP